MARRKGVKINHLTKDVNVGEEEFEKITGGLNPQPLPPATGGIEREGLRIVGSSSEG